MNKTIKIIVGAILSLAVASCTGKQSKFQEETAGDIVEITPSFTDAVHQFDELYPFSEGLAAVKKNDKFGFIDTKGKLIIPCQFDNVCAFSEGLSLVMDNEYNISILSKDGKVKHTPYKLDASYYGLGGWHGDKGYYMFRFQDKKCSIKTENYPDAIIIDEHGKECVNKSDENFTTNDFCSSTDTICHNPILLKFSSEKQNIFGDKETYYGIKDSSNNIIASAKYTYIDEYRNGVALCIIFVGNAETKGIPYGIHLPDGEYFFGYIDKKGNTTFTEADMEKIESYKESQVSAYANLKQQEEEQARLEEEQRIQEENRPIIREVYFDYSVHKDKIESIRASHGYYISWCNDIVSNMIEIPQGKKWIFKGINKNRSAQIITYSFYGGALRQDKTYDVSVHTHETYQFFGGDKIKVSIDPYYDDSDKIIFTFIEKPEYD